jgi:hypothetical protein
MAHEPSHSSKLHAAFCSSLVRFCERNSVQGDNRDPNSIKAHLRTRKARLASASAYQ